MSYEFYKVLHLAGVFLTLMSLAGALIHAIGGGTKTTLPFRKGIAVAHSAGLTFIGVAGFGLLARLELMSSIPVWAWLKIIIWIALGTALSVAYRKPQWSKSTWYLVIAFAILAAYFARYKPF